MKPEFNWEKNTEEKTNWNEAGNEKLSDSNEQASPAEQIAETSGRTGSLDQRMVT